MSFAAIRPLIRSTASLTGLSEMGVTLRRRYLAVAHETADDLKAVPLVATDAGKGVAEIVEPHVLSFE
jgi:hypothetical protein